MRSLSNATEYSALAPPKKLGPLEAALWGRACVRRHVCNFFRANSRRGCVVVPYGLGNTLRGEPLVALAYRHPNDADDIRIRGVPVPSYVQTFYMMRDGEADARLLEALSSPGVYAFEERVWIAPNGDVVVISTSEGRSK